jgi:hypothetical protein
MKKRMEVGSTSQSKLLTAKLITALNVVIAKKKAELGEMHARSIIS